MGRRPGSESKESQENQLGHVLPFMSSPQKPHGVTSAPARPDASREGTLSPASYREKCQGPSLARARAMEEVAVATLG